MVSNDSLFRSHNPVECLVFFYVYLYRFFTMFEPFQWDNGTPGKSWQGRKCSNLFNISQSYFFFFIPVGVDLLAEPQI